MLQEGKDFYYNEQGLLVLTEQFLLQRGYCCGNGCKHCPYNWEKVNEQKRNLLIEQQQSKDEEYY